MKIKLPAGAALIWPVDSPRSVLIDAKLKTKLLRVRWRFIANKKRFRGYFGRKSTRTYLHRYVLELNRRYYPEVTFANGSEYDCRAINLKPYRRDVEGANRALFKNSSSKRKGVSWHKTRKKWTAMIRAKGKLKNLGYFSSADLAAAAYARAWNLAHPDLQPMITQIRK